MDTFFKKEKGKREEESEIGRNLLFPMEIKEKDAFLDGITKLF